MRSILARQARMLPAFVLSAVGLFAVLPGSARALTELDAEAELVPGEVLVKFRPSVSAQARSAVLDRNDASTKSRLPIPGVQLVRIDSNESVTDAVDSFESEPQVLYAEPNFIYREQATPNDPLFEDLWGLDNTGQIVNEELGSADADIDATLAWDATTGSSSVVVAVVDSGVAYDHPELAPNVVPGWDFVDDDNDPRDFKGHGTHVAGTIGAAGNNGAGIAGVNWDVSLMPVRVLDGKGSGSNDQVAAGLAYAAAQGADIVNASLSGPGFSNTMLEAIQNAPNTLFVVAAGNEAEDNDFAPRYPCNYATANIVCVAATDQDDQLAGFSNYGADSVDLAAPGTNILSTQPAYGAPIFSEGFESDISSTWTTGGTNNTWARTKEAASTGEFSLTDSEGANYVNNTNSFARNTNPFSLSGQSGCQVEYALALESQSKLDGVAVEATTNPSLTWTTLGSWTGSTGGEFFTLRNDLSAFDGLGTVFIRFRFASNGSIVFDGAHIDDVAVRCLTSTYSGDEFQFLDGTSMATPQVAGAAALALADQPGLSTAALKSALLSNVDFRPGLASLTVTGGRLNVAATLGLVEPEPEPKPQPGPTPTTSVALPGTPTVTTPRRSGVDSACLAAKRALAKAKAKLRKAKKALKQAETAGQTKAAQRQVSQATKKLAKAKRKAKEAC